MRGLTDSQRRRETARRAVRMTAALAMVLSMVVSMSAVPVAAQEETNPCAFGPPVPGQDQDDIGDIEAGLTLDSSGSMTVVEQQVRDAAKNLSGSLDKTTDEASVVSFSPAVALQNLTGDFAAVNSSIDSYTADSNNGSDIGAGIKVSRNQLLNSTNASSGAIKALVVVSDGRAGDKQKARDQANITKAAGITIITVAINDSALNNPPDLELMEDLASDPKYAYTADDETDLGAIFEQVEEDLQLIGGGLEVNTRDLFKPGATHGYEVVNVTEIIDAETGDVDVTRENVTDAANLTSSNSSVLSVNDGNNTLTAASDPDTATWVRISATYEDKQGCTNVIVSQPTVENLELVPGIWRATAIAGDATLFALLIATLLAVPAARFTSAFGGLALAQMVVVVAWFAGYINFGIAAASLFVALFIGLNLAANIDYQAGNIGRR